MIRPTPGRPAMFLYLLILLWPAITGAQVLQPTAKPDPAISPERLARIDRLMNDYVSRNWVKGVVTLVIHDGRVVQYKGYGFLDAEAGTPMPSNAIFRIMSQTKAIVSVGAMMLYEQGRFLLDEPIADFIPEFRHPVVLAEYHPGDTTYTTVPAKREITFRDLLTHTSGLDYPDIGSETMQAIYAKAGVPSGLGYFDASLLERMKALARLPLAHQPGERFTYGLNSDLLGCLIEVISGMNLEDYLRRNLFEPLGMKDTYFNVPRTKAGRMAAVYTEDSLGHIIRWSHSFRHIDPDYPLMDKHYFSGGAGLSSTALDYGIFMQMLLNHGAYNGRQLLSPRTVELMTENQIGDIPLGLDKFGLGFQITSEKGAAAGPRSKGSFGWGGYYGTTYWADPEKKLVCLMMTQHTPNSHGDLEKRFEVLVYQALLK
ncbi:MAG TPA: serine hydrolase domain-containing protein [Chitinophagaceae bacterium]|nr:serine hydrolase domain-containing protein [Chitinophagaceae bacterium]